MFMSFINWPYYYFFFIKDDRSYLIFLESLLTISSTPHSSNHFSKLENIPNKTRLFNPVFFIKKTKIISINFLNFIFKKKKGKKKKKIFFFFFHQSMIIK